MTHRNGHLLLSTRTQKRLAWGGARLRAGYFLLGVLVGGFLGYESGARICERVTRRAVQETGETVEQLQRYVTAHDSLRAERRRIASRWVDDPDAALLALWAEAR